MDEETNLNQEQNTQGLPKHHKWLWPLVVALVLVVIGVSAWAVYNNPNEDGIFETGALVVSLGEEFTLKKGETASILEMNVLLKVTDFIYSPCPEGAQCVWSGLGVAYELTIDGETYNSSTGNTPREAPLDVLIVNSDYKTFATFIIDKPEARCVKLTGISQDGCWKELTQRFDDQIYCDNIQKTSIKDRCLEDLAEKFLDSDLCKNVISPIQYCQYINLVPQKALSQCDSIRYFSWRVKCFQDIAAESEKGIEICDTLEESKVDACREALIDLDD